MQPAHPTSAPSGRGSFIRTHYGTGRGLVRLLLSYAQVASGRAHVVMPDPGSVRRFVFVCQGNICRSAFADRLACDLGYASASFGLSTFADGPAHPPAAAAAADRGVDLSSHRTSTVEDYAPQRGDFLLAMEVRQLGRIADDPRLSGMPRALLGQWAKPPRPHLHDPFELDQAYMATCLETIDMAVRRLAAVYPSARSSGAR